MPSCRPSLPQTAYRQLTRPVSSGTMGRRAFLGLAAAGLMGALGAMTGCDGNSDPSDIAAFLGIGVQEETGGIKVEGLAASNNVSFDNLVVTISTDPTTWQWSQITNPASPCFANLVVGIPVNCQNNTEFQRSMSSVYCKVLDPEGNAMPDISAMFRENDLLQLGSIAPGKNRDAVLHVVYRHAGVYTIAFDNLLGRKANLTVHLMGGGTTGYSPVTSWLPDFDAEAAINPGVSFEVNGLTFTFSPNDGAYLWDQVLDPNSPLYTYATVGVPVTITNNSGIAKTIPASSYILYGTDQVQWTDPSPWVDYSAACLIGEIAPGQTVETAFHWAFEDSGWHYIAFFEDGGRIVARVHMGAW